jgi:uncharacterized protein (DUF169 family)
MQNKATSNGRDEHAVVDLGVLARALRSALGLRLRPVALSFAVEHPESIDAFAGEVPSACAFWRRAEEKTFFAPAEAHDNCPIGALTMGMAMTDERKAILMALVGKITEMGYVDVTEAANIPSVPGDKAGIVYGPLESFPLEPDVVLVWVSPSSAMLLAEATGTSRWTPEQQGAATYGRPSCGAIPIALQNRAATFSLGCTGMRTFTAVDADLQLAVLPMSALPGLAQRLEAASVVNAQMQDYYTAQNARFAPGAAAV